MLANLIPGWSWSFSSPTLGRIARVLILLALWTYVSGVAALSAVLSTMPCVVAQAIPRPHQREARVLCAAACLTWSSSGISRPRLGKARRHRCTTERGCLLVASAPGLTSRTFGKFGSLLAAFFTASTVVTSASRSKFKARKPVLKSRAAAYRTLQPSFLWESPPRAG